MKYLLECKNISKSYKRKKSKVAVLNSICCSFEKKKLYAIMGESGAGKSTLIQILGILKDFDSGELIIDGKNVEQLNSKEKALIRNKKIGFVFQSFYLNHLLKAFENVMLPLNINCKLSEKEKKKRAVEKLKYFGLTDRINHFPFELSGGEQQRVALARALVNNPTMIIADEPTGNLDPETAWDIMNLLNEINARGTTVVMATHAKDIVDKMKKRVIEINKGVIVRDDRKGGYDSGK